MTSNQETMVMNVLVSRKPGTNAFAQAPRANNALLLQSRAVAASDVR